MIKRSKKFIYAVLGVGLISNFDMPGNALNNLFVSEVRASVETLNVSWAEGGSVKFDTSTGEIIGASYQITSIDIPEKIDGVTVTSIANTAFHGCEFLTHITIPNTVTKIGNAAFYDCSSLVKVTIPNSVVSIGDYAFRYCTSLKTITIPDSASTIGQSAFAYCESLLSVTLPNTLTAINNNLFFGCKSLKGLVIPDSVVSIGQSAFQYCESLTKVSLPNSITNIGMWAFEYCTGLKSISLPNSITSIAQNTFSNCESLISITIPSSVKSIAQNSFQNCTSLSSVTIPYSVQNINKGAFLSCDSIKNVHYRNTEEKWSEISIKDSNDDLLNATIHYLTEEAAEKEKENTVAAIPTASTVLLNNTELDLEAYNIDGSNYFKLRDVANILDETTSKFDVSWDENKNAINLISSENYTIVGGELSTVKTKEENATLNKSPIYLDGSEISLTAYNINETNYFKLRDLGDALDFSVDWHEETNSIKINTEN